MKRDLHVACAIIEQEGKVLAAQRSVTMTLPVICEYMTTILIAEGGSV